MRTDDVRTTDGRTDRMTDGRADGHMDGQRENIIPRHYVWWDLKNTKL